MIRSILLALALAAGVSSAAQAQQARVVASCGSQALRLNDPSSQTIDQTGRLCVATDSVVQGTAAYRGGTITTANASQQLMAANTARRGFSVQNQSTGDLYIKVGQTATTSNLSLKIAAGALYESPPQHVSPSVINIIGATAGQAFYATEY